MILHILSLSRQAGVEVMFLNYLKCMKKNDPNFLKEQVVFVFGISPYFKEQLERLNINYIEAKRTRKFDIRFLIQLFLLIKKIKPRVVYGHNYIGNVIVALTKLFYRRCSTICHEHGTAWSAGKVKFVMNLFWTKYCDRIICNSKAAKTILCDRYNTNEQKIKVIYNGVPVPSQKGKVVKKDKNLLLFVGRLERVKSPETIVYAMDEIVKRLPEMKLIFVGDGSMKNNLEQLTKEKGLSNNISFTGNLSDRDVQKQMAKATLLILPSMREALGNVIIEAAFQRTPTVATNIDGIPEVIVDKQTGVLIKATEKVRDKNSPPLVVDPMTQSLIKPMVIEPMVLANVILEIINSNYLPEMGNHANKHVKDRFSINTFYRNITNEIMKKV